MPGVPAGRHPLFRVAIERLVIREGFGHKAATMKLTIAFLSIILTLGLGACSTCQKPTKEAILVPCCSSLEKEKVVLLQDSFVPGGRVVRLVH